MVLKKTQVHSSSHKLKQQQLTETAEFSPTKNLGNETLT
jgi:hypothetical protein